MERILGIDVGDKRVGVALSDPLGRCASPQPTLLRAGGKAEAQILNILQEYGIKLLVVGMPFGADGSRNGQCEKVENFCRRLRKRANVEIVYVDEHLSSEEAKERLQASGVKSFSKEDIDATAATLILQSYLDERTAVDRG